MRRREGGWTLGAMQRILSVLRAGSFIALSLLVALLAACGPAPDELADAETFCNDRELSLCGRDQFASRITDAEYDACVAAAPAMCAGAAWPTLCEPTMSDADACVVLLQRGDLAPLTNAELLAMYDDCNLCP